MNDIPICHKCGEMAYRNIQPGPVCRIHYLQALEEHLGPWVYLSENYKQAQGEYTPLPLFQEGVKIS